MEPTLRKDPLSHSPAISMEGLGGTKWEICHFESEREGPSPTTRSSFHSLVLVLSGLDCFASTKRHILFHLHLPHQLIQLWLRHSFVTTKTISQLKVPSETKEQIINKLTSFHNPISVCKAKNYCRTVGDWGSESLQSGPST